MAEKVFNNQIADAQGTDIEPMDIDDFDIAKYMDYEASLLEKNQQFWASDSGIAVYRRFRVPQVFTYGCRDMKHSLALQLAALTESMKYKADIANFLEPWYGLGTTASSFGLDYEWPDGQSPAIKAPFKTVEEALQYDVSPIEQTAIGKHTLEMIEYFLDKTHGKIPMSPADMQSPLDTASYLVDINNLLMSPFDNPDGLKKLLDIISDLLIDFTKKQIELIGDALVLPGHGFASSRKFTGLGMSDDVMMMLSGDQYAEFEAPILAKIGEHFAGAAFHSCGNWSPKIEAVKKIENLVTVDAAFSSETDPDPNPAKPFVDTFAGTGIVVNARVVGDTNVIIDKAKQLWKSGIKLIVVTYCKNTVEQKRVYEQIHTIA